MVTAAEQEGLVAQLRAVVGCGETQARQLLEVNDWNMEHAAEMYYADPPEEEGLSDEEADDRGADQSFAPGPPSSAAAAEPAAGRAKSNTQRKKFATLGDLSSGAPQGGDDDSGKEDMPQDLFAGGEKSGLAVQNPDDLKKKIIEKAKKGISGLGDDDSKPAKSHFTGTARTLGGDDAPSEVIEDPNANVPPPAERVTRTLHFWNDGFSVDDGDLYRTDDPVNAQILNGIRQGRAPLSIMNVQPGQEVDVEIQQHEGDYVKPKPKYKPFGGQGQRLGSPTPGPATQTAAPATAAAPAAAGTATQSGPEKPNVDESQPTVTLQIRLGDGSRLTSRFNTTHTIGDVYDFVTAADPANLTRSWVLMTTFPSTELKDKSVVLGDLKDFKRGGVVVQKWT